MYVSPGAVIAIAAALGLVLVLAFRRGSGSSGDLMQPPRPTAPMPPELASEVRMLLQQRRKIDAIKRVREEMRIGLSEAKQAVERLESTRI